MQGPILEVVKDPTLRHSFVFVSRRFFESTIMPMFLGAPPRLVPLRIVGPKGTSHVGCLTQSFHDQAGQNILFPGALARNLAIDNGDTVQCFPLAKLPIATKVLVAPITVDESEVVEKNAQQIQMQLLMQLQVVSLGMSVTVFLHSGMVAKLKVCEIECGEGNSIFNGGAIMEEGTYLIVETKQRVAAQSSSQRENSKPVWAFLRSQPPLSKSLPSSVVEVHPITAKQWSWNEDMAVSFLDVALLAQLKESSISSVFLRSSYREGKLKFSEEVEVGICRTCLRTVTNVLVTPSESLESRSQEENDLKEENVDEDLPTWDDVCAVHGSVPSQVLHHLEFSLAQKDKLTSGNVLLCGGKGYGKSTVAAVVLAKVKNVHIVKVKCFPGREFTEQLKSGLTEAVLCAPSILLLDDFDSIAPEQKEGNIVAMTDATKAMLQSVVSHFSGTASLLEKSTVLVVATCLSRDTLHQSFRSAAIFPSSWSLQALTRTTRQTLLTQCIPNATHDDIRKIAALLENYSPFDIQKFTFRVKCAADGDEDLVDRAQRIAASFTPMAHTGISFLKGDKVEWGSIGGLKEAKKVLYDTLVLPIQHPHLFSRLPLKTRSGILLYGASGCGKTFILESLVKAENLNCLVVNGPEVFGKYIGQSEQKIRDVFERAQAAAPCVVFFDEFDSVAPQRGTDNSGVTDRVVNQLLCYLDGVEGRKDIFVVAASSRPDLIDAALLRPGRLDKTVACPIPSLSDRQEILRSLLVKIPSTVTEDDISRLADLTPNWTPADLAALVSTANTMACQKILSSLTPAGTSFGGSTDDNYFISDFGNSQSIDKIKDRLKFLAITKNAEAKEVTHIQVTGQLLTDALKETRPSLSAADIRNFNRIHALFSKGETPIPPKPGTKLTSS